MFIKYKIVLKNCLTFTNCILTYIIQRNRKNVILFCTDISKISVVQCIFIVINNCLALPEKSDIAFPAFLPFYDG